MKRIVISLLMLLSLGCSRSFAKEPSCGFIMNGGLRVAWHNRFPLIIRLHTSVPVEAVPAIVRAMETWNTALRYPALILGEARQSGPTGFVYDGVPVIDWAATKAMEQGVTHVRYSGSTLYDGDVTVDNQNHVWSYGGVPPAGMVDLESLMVHELGHVLGLTHNPSRESVMYLELPMAVIRRVLHSADISNLLCEYWEQ
jgi:hypothetical protein